MKKTIFLFAVIMMSMSGFTAGIKYQKMMGKTLAGFAEASTVEDYRKLGNKFLVIARAEENQWLPYYYHAQCYILMSFDGKESPENKDAYLDEAEISVEEMIRLAPGEPEVYVMQGLLFSARLMVDPMTRGQKFSALSAQAIGKAQGIEPENPRARYMQIANEMGTARFFGDDVSAGCRKAEILYEEWDSYKLKSRIHPSWGKEPLAEIISQCKKNGN
jgi:hypothetical protein